MAIIFDNFFLPNSDILLKFRPFVMNSGVCRLHRGELFTVTWCGSSVVQGIQKVISSPRYPKGTSGTKYTKGTWWCDLFKRYLGFQSIENVPSSPRYPKGT